MNSYEAKIEARRERLEDAAERARAESESRYNRARQMADVIPLGQPMLVDHYSYKRDRNYRNRIQANYEKAFEADTRAKELAAKAAAVGTGGISSDDPDAPSKIQERLDELKAGQARMKAVNAAHKKFLKDPASLDKSALSDADKDRVRRYVPAYSWEPHPFPPYAMSNNNANIKRLEARLATLARKPTENSEEMIGEVRMVKNAEENRLQLFFPSKPDEAVREKLKGRGFRWSPMTGAWQRHLGNSAEWSARHILQQ